LPDAGLQVPRVGPFALLGQLSSTFKIPSPSESVVGCDVVVVGLTEVVVVVGRTEVVVVVGRIEVVDVVLTDVVVVLGRLVVVVGRIDDVVVVVG
jgi:hypothetical protein